MVRNYKIQNVTLTRPRLVDTITFYGIAYNHYCLLSMCTHTCYIVYKIHSSNPNCEHRRLYEITKMLKRRCSQFGTYMYLYVYNIHTMIN